MHLPELTLHFPLNIWGSNNSLPGSHSWLWTLSVCSDDDSDDRSDLSPRLNQSPHPSPLSLIDTQPTLPAQPWPHSSVIQSWQTPDFHKFWIFSAQPSPLFSLSQLGLVMAGVGRVTIPGCQTFHRPRSQHSPHIPPLPSLCS